MLEKKQARKVASKQRDTERRRNRRNKESYGFTMDMIITPEDANKLRKATELETRNQFKESMN